MIVEFAVEVDCLTVIHGCLKLHLPLLEMLHPIQSISSQSDRYYLVCYDAQLIADQF